MRQSLSLRLRRQGAALALGLAALGAAAGDDPKWVQGSWVNVRATAQPNGAVVTQWTVNTPVRLLATSGKWCEARANDGKRGFVACNLLGDKALTLAEAANPMRAFWISPSVERWMAAGQYLAVTMLSNAAREKEVAEKKPRRFPVPEFEAMKQLMQQGIVVKPEDLAAAPRLAASVADGPSPMLELLGRGTLKPVRSSLFKQPSDVVMVGQGDVDTLAAMTREPVRLKMLRPPALYSPPHSDGAFDGFWDVGEAEVILAAPITRHTVASNGLMGAAQGRRFRVNGQQFDRCGYESQILPSDEQPLRGYPAIKEPIVEFFLPKGLNARKVNVSSRSAKVRINDEQGKSVPTKTLLYDIDLDGDGIPDIAVWQGLVPHEIYDLPTWWARFVNIDGQWYLASSFLDPDCT